MSAESHQPIPVAIAEAAAAWLAKRDRGLSPAEQDDYMQWLAADPRHPEALSQHAAALERMMQLYEWQPSHDSEPNPDLFSPRQSLVATAGKPSRSASAVHWLRTHWTWSAGLAAAAAVAVFAYVAGSRTNAPESTPATAPKSYLRVNERMALPDGSRVELKDGTKVVVRYSETERRVELTGGEAHFSVWKDRNRPFIVDAAGVEVRAVGTAFNVRLEADKVEVLVTEGRVAVDTATGRASPPDEPTPHGAAPIFITVGERAVVPLAVAVTETIRPVVSEVTLEDIVRELAWQAPRLQFHETPLTEAVTEFNRLNRHQLVVGEPGLTALRIGGTFRPDNVEGFIRLLGETLDIMAEPAGENRTVLRRR